MVSGGDIDVLTGDWLAELTMLILARQRSKRPDTGYASTFVEQMRDVLADCVGRGIRVVSNAGGVNPEGCADAVRKVAAQLGIEARVAAVVGDDLLPRLADLQHEGEAFAHLENGQVLADAGVSPLSANAYLGGWGIATALAAGADVVVTGRVTDAALVVGPAAWWHDWELDEWDALAGAVVAGHVIECGAQTTGGNFAFFSEVPGLEHPGFPIAEVAHDGSSVITKHPGTGGIVSVETVTAQLLYEIAGPRYPNPDVVARFDSIRLEQLAPDRVQIGEVRGEPAPPTTKVCINYLGGFRNSVTFALTGLDIEEKAALAERELLASIPGGKDAFDDWGAEVLKGDGEGFGLLYVTAVDQDATKVGRAFSNKATEMGLATYPGYFTTAPPGDAREFGVYWPALVDSDVVEQKVVLDGESLRVPRPPTIELAENERTSERAPGTEEWTSFVTGPLGRLVGARSGDKGGDANVGVWVRTTKAYDWLAQVLTPERIHELLPETRTFIVDRYELANLGAMNFVVRGLLGRGVAASTRFDAQAKSLGERLRASLVDLPAALLANG